jgi:hypothetical protein
MMMAGFVLFGEPSDMPVYLLIAALFFIACLFSHRSVWKQTANDSICRLTYLCMLLTCALGGIASGIAFAIYFSLAIAELIDWGI